MVCLSGLAITAGSILVRAHAGLQVRSQVGVFERQPHTPMFLSLFLPPFPSLYK